MLKKCRIKLIFALVVTLIMLLSSCEFFNTIFYGPLYEVEVNINPAEGGTVTVFSDAENEGEGSMYAFRKESRVTLTAVPEEGYYFYSWTGDAEGSDKEKTLEIYNDMDITANFYKPEDGWLIMLYLDGANNLNTDALIDLNDIEYGLSQIPLAEQGEITIIALYDGITFNDSRIYTVTPDADNNTINSTEETGWWGSKATELEMGNVETLKNFINWCKERYLAKDKHALILWNHGGGARAITDNPLSSPRHICSDDETGSGINHILYLDEVQEAVGEYYSIDNKLDLLGMDACLMGTVEVAYEFRESVEYMAFSPASELGGWDYEPLIAGLTGDTTDEVFAENIVKTFRDKAASLNITINTQTAVDLSNIGELKTKLDVLASAIDTEYGTSHGTIETIRDSSTHYYTSDNDSVECPYFEIGDFCDRLIYGAPNVENQANAVKTTLAACIVYAWAGADMGAYDEANISRGLSIFFSRGNLTYVEPTEEPPEEHYHYAYQWWYTSEDTNSWWSGGNYYGNIDFCNSDTNGSVETWRELMEAWYDPLPSNATPGRW